jgi:hypothetical protein
MTNQTNIAALFVETDGCYFGQAGVEPWDITRDARTYAGPWPVVAHPPCQRGGPLLAWQHGQAAPVQEGRGRRLLCCGADGGAQLR